MRNILTALFLLFFGHQFASAQIKASGTVYYPGYRGMGTVTASGSRVNLAKLKKGEIRWIALSKDLFKHFKMGDTVVVHCDNEAFRGEWIVKDRMGTRHSRSVDFMLHHRHNLKLHSIRNLLLYKKGEEPTD